ncbi:MAG TPA: hypothetical protein VLN44_01690 [Pyrinomonadaceae bacterium]|nr:hypothetical protein [Pyrinomonadaceae bacterium]
MKQFLFAFTLIILGSFITRAQQPNEQRAALNETAIAFDARSAPALEARLLTQVLNGAEDSPVTNVKISVKNTTPNFYTYVSGWATFYDANAIRCGEGLFKVDALAPQESAEVDTPGLRLRCSPQSWRVVATNLMTRTVDIAKPTEPAPPVQAAPAAVPQRPAPMNFIISVDGEEHPIQVNNPITLRLGERDRRIIIRPVP